MLEYGMFALDDLNKAILVHLREGRKSFKRIAEATAVSENTVKARVRRLETEGVLDIAGYVNPHAIEGHQIVYVGVKLANLDYIATAEKISRLRRVVSVGVVTGHYDMIVTVHLDATFNLLDFLSRELGSVESIQSTETFVVYKNFDIRVPYPANDQGEAP